MMRINVSRQIQRHESATVERTTCEESTDDTREPLLGKKTSLLCVVDMDGTYFPGFVKNVKGKLSKCNPYTLFCPVVIA